MYKRQQTRSFCYVDDLIEGMVSLMDSNIHTPINIGNPEEFKIIQLANKIKEIINPNLDFIYKDLPEDDPSQRRPDISKAKKYLHWQPKINFEKGIHLTIEWFKNTYSL